MAKRKPKTVEQLIALASEAYPDGLVQQSFEEGTGQVGDLLSDFIATELSETYDGINPVQTAIEKLESAQSDLGEVISALYKASAMEAQDFFR
jgi:hypothetical protein